MNAKIASLSLLIAIVALSALAIHDSQKRINDSFIEFQRLTNERLERLEKR